MNAIISFAPALAKPYIAAMSSAPMKLAAQIEARLQAHFTPHSLKVDDESAQHADHAEAYPDGESHFRVHIVAEAFANQPRLARHRAIHAALGKPLMERIHALVIHASAPDDKSSDTPSG